MGGSEPEIEFSAWETPFVNGGLFIVSIAYGGEFSVIPHPGGPQYTVPGENSDNAALVVRVFHLPGRASYRISFDGPVGGFRMIDEGGLLEFWEPGPSSHACPPGVSHTTFKVRNHLWSRESAGIFLSHTNDGWSYVIATDDECVEVIASQPPFITLEQTIKGVPLLPS